LVIVGEYHPVGGENGSFWEENGRYYFVRDGLKHDVTDLMKDRYQQEGLDEEEEEEEEEEEDIGGVDKNAGKNASQLQQQQQQGKKKAKKKVKGNRRKNK
jgi:hypothetical protein